MTTKSPVISSEVREIVCTLAPAAGGENALCRLIFDVLTATNVDTRTVPLDEVKSLMVDAIRAYRHSRFPELLESLA